MFSPSLAGLVATIIVSACYYIYRLTFPKPIPGIPYLQASGNRPFGDLSDFLKHVKKTQQPVAFMGLRAEELNAPVVQLFVKPFSKPVVVVADAQE